jgi:hypothetical protein
MGFTVLFLTPVSIQGLASMTIRIQEKYFLFSAHYFTSHNVDLSAQSDNDHVEDY